MGVALSSCASTPAPPAPVSVVLVQQRGDVAPRRAQLRVTNTSKAPVTVVSAMLESAALAQPAGGPTKHPVTIEPGRTVDLPVPLDAVRCTTEDVSPDAVLSLQGSASAEATVPVEDALDVLERATATECDREAVASVASISAVSASAGANGTIDLTLAIDPTGDPDAGRIGLIALRGTPLLRFPSGTETMLDTAVAADDAASTLAVEVVPQRCDAHAIAEDKVGTLFDLVVGVDGREVVVPLTRTPEVAAALLSATASVCGLTP